jgi:hypothetical protein
MLDVELVHASTEQAAQSHAGAILQFLGKKSLGLAVRSYFDLLDSHILVLSEVARRRRRSLRTASARRRRAKPLRFSRD